MVDKEKKEEILKLITDGQKALNIEEKASLWGWQPFPSYRLTALNKKYKEWLERFIEVTESTESYAIEQQIIIMARQEGYYKVILYWKQHINELKNIL